MPIDLRSDTVTKPSESMRQAMARAAVGDDVFGEDPTVRQLEDRLADLFGHEAGLFCPSGTMTNQIAINVHTRPGDEIICDKDSHIYKYEGGGIMANSGCSVKFVTGDRGRFSVADIEAALNPPADPHMPLSRLVSVENTFNRGGGSVWDMEQIKAIQTFCGEKSLGLHLDGARIFNALVATGVDAKTMGSCFDSVSICLSKGLGAPVGSVLVGSKDFIAHAVRVRKRFGGGMRQVGILAAAGLFALDNHIDLLAIDHARASKIAAALPELPYVASVIPVETNIVVFKVNHAHTVSDLVKKLDKSGVRAIPFGADMIRLVTHLGLNEHDIDETIRALRAIA